MSRRRLDISRLVFANGTTVTFGDGRRRGLEITDEPSMRREVLEQLNQPVEPTPPAHVDGFSEDEHEDDLIRLGSDFQ